MPGMMDTILNLGLNDVAADGLARLTGNERFARDSYRRLLQMFGEVVDGVDGHRFESALAELKARRNAAHDTDLTAEDLRDLIATYKDIYRSDTGRDFPQDAREQLRRSIARSSTRGTRRAHRCIAVHTASPTTSARP